MLFICTFIHTLITRPLIWLSEVHLQLDTFFSTYLYLNWRWVYILFQTLSLCTLYNTSVSHCLRSPGEQDPLNSDTERKHEGSADDVSTGSEGSHGWPHCVQAHKLHPTSDPGQNQTAVYSRLICLMGKKIQHFLVNVAAVFIGEPPPPVSVSVQISVTDQPENKSVTLFKEHSVATRTTHK